MKRLTHITGTRIAALGLMAVLGACSANSTLLIKSIPESAKIFVNGREVGTTPKRVVLPFDDAPRVFINIVHPQREPAFDIMKPITLPLDLEKTYSLQVGH